MQIIVIVIALIILFWLLKTFWIALLLTALTTSRQRLRLS